MHRTSWLFLLLIVGVAGALSAQSEVTEADFLDSVDEVHPALVALAGDLGAAEADRLRASLLSDPRLEVEREQLDGVDSELVAGIAWTPPVDGRRRWAVRAAEEGVEVERLLLEWKLAELRRSIRHVYAAWAGGEARVSLVAEHSSRLDALSKRMGKRAEAGEESLLDARRLSIAAGNSRAALSTARAQSVAAKAMAGAWLTDEQQGLLDGNAAMPRLPLPPDDLDTAARPDLLAAHSRVERSEANAKLSRRVFSSPELLVGWKEIKAEESDLRLSGPVFAVNWTIPVFNRQRADRMAADNEVSLVMVEREWAQRSADAELAAALASYSELRLSALSAADALADLGGVPAAAMAAYEQGESSVTDLLDSLEAVLEARLAALDLHVAAIEAHRELELAAGRTLATGDPS